MACSLQIEADLGWIVWMTLGNVSEYRNFLTKSSLVTEYWIVFETLKVSSSFQGQLAVVWIT
jgi:hypothetical protein